MASTQPTVSVVLPVYNEELYLADTIESILAQTYSDFELIISDNASTDGTEAICHEKQKQNSRIRYYRNTTNTSSIQNFWSTLQKSKGDFFLFAAGHDRWAPNFIEACLRPLKENPRVVLAYAAARWLEAGGQTEDIIGQPVDTRSLTKQRRFLQVIQSIEMYAVYGIYRRSVFEKISPMQNHLGPDLLLLAELSLLGEIAYVPGTELYLRRTHDIAHLQKHVHKIHLQLGPSRSIQICTNFFQNHFLLIEKYFPGRWNRIGIKWKTVLILLRRCHRLLGFILLAGWAPYWTNRLFRACGKPEPLHSPQQVG